MKHTSIFVSAVLMISLNQTVAQEKKLQKSQLPTAVAATVYRETKGAEIKGFATETEHGKKVYEAETIVAGHTRDLQIAADGTLNEVEEEVAFDSLAQPVRDALKRKSAKGRIVKVELLTKQGKLVAYEASTMTNGRKGELRVGPNGESLQHEE